MKSRLLRALGVGAALAIPLGGVAVLGTGIAGATTPPKLHIPATATVTMAGVTVHLGLSSTVVTSGAGSFHSAAGAYTFTTTPNLISLTATINSAATPGTYTTTSKAVTAMTFKSGTAKLTTTTYKGCQITGLKLPFALTGTHLKVAANTKLTGATVKAQTGKSATCPATGTKQTTIGGKIAATTISGTATGSTVS